MTATLSPPVAAASRKRISLRMPVLFGAIAILLICTAAREIESFRNLGDISSTSGTWIATAVDAEHGILYRPLVSSLGYGGTRYAPMRTLVQAVLLKATALSPVESALLTSVISTLLLLAGVYALMRRLDVPPPAAVALACFPFACNCVRASLLAGMADPLAAALSIWGIVAITFGRRSTDTYAAVFFSLAVATKITSIFGVASAVIWLLCNKEYRRAVFCAVITIFLVLALVAIFQVASDGRMLAVFRACASGGAGWDQIVQAPLVFSGILCRFDPVAGAIWLTAIFTIILTRQFMSLPAILLLTTTADTLVIYGSPGTDMNHLLDLVAASIACLGISFSRERKLVPILITLALCGAAVSMKDAVRIRNDARMDSISRALAMAQKSPGSGPILCENPLLPILAGERPYMLDCFMFRVYTESNPPLGKQLWNALDERRFRAVILCPVGGEAEMKTPGNFSYETIPHVEATYQLIDREGKYFVFLPKGGPQKAK